MWAIAWPRPTKPRRRSRPNSRNRRIWRCARPLSPPPTTARTTAPSSSPRVNAALADVPPDRVAGAIAITDGEVHDAPAPSKMRLQGAAAGTDRGQARRTRPQAHRHRRRALRHRRPRCPDRAQGRRFRRPHRQRGGNHADVDLRIDGKDARHAVRAGGAQDHAQRADHPWRRKRGRARGRKARARRS